MVRLRMSILAIANDTIILESTIITLADWYHVLAPAAQDTFFTTGSIPCVVSTERAACKLTELSVSIADSSKFLRISDDGYCHNASIALINGRGRYNGGVSFSPWCHFLSLIQ